MITDGLRRRGRPRRFDPEQAVATAQRLFHAHGYDAVSIADLTGALGINPPSFYAAFGSKAGLYARVLQRYSADGALFLGEFLRPGRPVAESLSALLEAVARAYAAHPETAGCLVLEGTRCNDTEARRSACDTRGASQEIIRAFVAARHPEDVDRITDYVDTVMAGLSAMARSGHDLDRLVATARLASTALSQAMPEMST